VKKTDLKKLIKEEIKKVLSENTKDVKDEFPTEPGKYEIEYRTSDDSKEEGTVSISQNDIDDITDSKPSIFWKGEASNISNFRIIKVLKVTKIK